MGHQDPCRCKMQARRHGVWQVMGMPASPLAARPLEEVPHTVQGVWLVLSKRQALGGSATHCCPSLDNGDIVSAQLLLIGRSSLGLQAIRRTHTTT